VKEAKPSNQFDFMYRKRFYRNYSYNNLLCRFEVKHFESDLLIWADTDLSCIAHKVLVDFHTQISEYIRQNPDFAVSLEPLPFDPESPAIIQAMFLAASAADVGPMAAVAGAIAEAVGRVLMEKSEEVIVENGGDIFIAAKKVKKIGIYAGIGNAYNQLVLKIDPKKTPCGICTSSGKVGHSLSFGNSSATVVICDICAQADSLATFLANMIKTDDDLSIAVKKAREFPQIKGIIALTSSKLTAYGDIQFDILDNRT
jgi:ApbE superfamily uncharacterized protein (UPF0280 family)